MPDSGGDSVIGRVVRLLSAFDRNSRSLPLTTLANRADLPLTTAHRLVNELVKHGLLERASNKEISIGLRLWESSAHGSHTMTLREAALPFMEDLQTILRQHVSLAVLDAGSVLFLERLASPDSTLDAGRMADRYPLHGCSTGLVLLALSSPEYQSKVLSGPLDKLTDRTVTDPVLLRRILAEVRQQRFFHAAGFGIERWSGIAVPIIGEHGAVIAGERDPKVLAQLARSRMRAKIARLEEAFNGHFDDHHAFLLAPFGSAAACLDEIPGIGPVVAAAILAEVGVDMSRFPTAGHLCSWAKFSPGISSSAGKSKGNGATGHGNRYLARTLGEVAVVAGRTDTFLGARYRRIARRRGKKRAIVAVGRSILVIVWHLFSDDHTTFHDLGPDHYSRYINPDTKKRNHIRQLEALGYTVTLTPAA